MSQIKYQNVFLEFSKSPNLFELNKKILSFMNLEQLNTLADSLYEDITKELNSFAVEKGLHVNDVISYFEDDINNNLPEHITQEIDKYNNTLNVLLNEVAELMDSLEKSKEISSTQQSSTTQEDDFTKKLKTLNEKKDDLFNLDELNKITNNDINESNNDYI